ncbi:MAG TPA: response regulator transcription factor [Bryobacteraceae bacterium]
MTEKQDIVIADDHPVVRHGLRLAIEADPMLRVVAEAPEGETALTSIQKLRPQIAVLDIDMPKKSGFEVARSVRTLQIPVRIVFLTIHSEEDLFHAGMDLGARGYILKESAMLEIVNGLRAIASGQYYVSPALTGYLLNRSRRSQALEEDQPSLTKLTPAERRVLQLIADGKSSKEIGSELFIHFRTVENHRYAICQKLGLSGPNALLRFALQHKSDL